MSSILCAAPWHALAIRPDGQIYPDGQFSKPYGYISKDSLSELWHSSVAKELRRSFLSGETNSGCANCIKKETSIGHSRRLYFKDKIEPQIDIKKSSSLESPDIRYLDLNLSNKCNLKCRMCNSKSSTSWIQEEKMMGEILSRKFNMPDVSEYSRVDSSDIKNFLSDRDSFKNLSHIGIHGGEPLLEEQNFIALEEIVRHGNSKNIAIEVSTNGTIVNHDFLKILNKFKEVIFSISIEAVGNLYSYIRGGDGFSISMLEKNIQEFRKYSSFNLIYSSTLSVYNIFSLGQLIDWFDDFGKSNEEIIMKNVVVRPEYLNFQILPNDLKKIALFRLESYKNFEKKYMSSKRKFGSPGLNLIMESLKIQVYHRDNQMKLLEQFVQFTTTVDRYRKTNILDHIPELEILFRNSSDLEVRL